MQRRDVLFIIEGCDRRGQTIVRSKVGVCRRGQRSSTLGESWTCYGFRTVHIDARWARVAEQYIQLVISVRTNFEIVFFLDSKLGNFFRKKMKGKRDTKNSYIIVRLDIKGGKTNLLIKWQRLTDSGGQPSTNFRILHWWPTAVKTKIKTLLGTVCPGGTGQHGLFMGEFPAGDIIMTHRALIMLAPSC